MPYTCTKLLGLLHMVTRWSRTRLSWTVEATWSRYSLESLAFDFLIDFPQVNVEFRSAASSRPDRIPALEGKGPMIWDEGLWRPLGLVWDGDLLGVLPGHRPGHSLAKDRAPLRLRFCSPPAAAPAPLGPLGAWDRRRDRRDCRDFRNSLRYRSAGAAPAVIAVSVP